MKLILATVTLLSLLASETTAWGPAGDELEVNPAMHDHARRRHAHMWMFGENGVSIFTPDGSEEVKTIPPEKVCKNVTSDDGSSRVRCDFTDVVSDGNKFVWASVARGVPKIDVFRIDTGDLVGSFQTCGSPGDLDVHPLREEIWVHCSEYSNTSDSHMDVFSTVSPTAPIPATIQMHDNTNLRSRGKIAVHSDMGDVAYSTVSGQPYLYKIDLAERMVMEQYTFEEDNPKFYGLYDMTYSPMNGHLYARTEVCCTCGFEGADALECGRYGSKNITISGEEVEGQCGRHCQGGVTDNIGIIEFDTHTDTVVGTHPFVGTAPTYAPFTSPDGEFIILFGLDGGSTVQMLKAGTNGEKSEVSRTLSLSFNTTNVEEDSVYRDFAYIKTEEMNVFVVSSSSDYKVAIVDMDSATEGGDYVVEYVSLKDIPYEGRSYSRQVEWVEGTNYVWIGGQQDDEAYVIDLSTNKLIKTFTEVDPRKLLSVTPYGFLGMADEYSTHFQDSMGSQTASMYSALSGDGGGNENSSSDKLSIAALAMSIIAIAAVLASFFAKNQASSPSNDGALAVTSTKKVDDPSLAVPPSVA